MGALALELGSGHGASPERVILLLTLAALVSGGLQVALRPARRRHAHQVHPLPGRHRLPERRRRRDLPQAAPRPVRLPRASCRTGRGSRGPRAGARPGSPSGSSRSPSCSLAPRLTKRVPAAILGLAARASPATSRSASSSTHAADARGQPPGDRPAGRRPAARRSPRSAARFAALRELGLADLALLLMPALTLSVLLSIDTLKTCVVVDALTRTRHASNRELIGQGVANLASAAIGGVPGSGTSGATLVNIASGGETRRSGLIEGLLVIVAYLALGGLVAWAPIAALAGILVVVAYRMFDWGSVRLLRQRSTVLDFVVVASVIAVAVFVGLVAASGTGDRALDPAVHPRADPRQRDPPQDVRRPGVLAPEAAGRGDGRAEAARRRDGRLRAGGQPVLRHHGPAVHPARGRPQAAPLRDPRHAPRALGRPDRRPHAGAVGGAAARARRHAAVQQPAEGAAERAEPARVLRRGRPRRAGEPRAQLRPALRRARVGRGPHPGGGGPGARPPRRPRSACARSRS